MTTFDPTTIREGWLYYWKKLCEVYKIDPIYNLENEGLKLFEKINDYDNLEYKFIELTSNIKSVHFEDELENYVLTQYNSFSLEDLDYENYEIYQLYNCIAENIKSCPTSYDFVYQVKHKEIKFRGMESALKSALEGLKERSHIEHKLRKYFSYDINSIRRSKDKKVNDYWITKPFEFKKDQAEPIMKSIVRRLDERILTDGMSYFYHINLESPTFNSMLKANLDLYYSRNIINTSMHATKIYLATHKSCPKLTNCTKESCTKLHCLWMDYGAKQPVHDDTICNKDCKFIEYVYSDPVKLPTPKKGQVIITPLRFRVKPQFKTIREINKYDNQIKSYEIIRPIDSQSMDIKTLNDLKDKEIAKEENGNYYIIDHKKYIKWEAKEFRQEWLELKLWNRTYSISIERYKSTDYNATLAIDLRPQKGLYTKSRSITAKLHINPQSYNVIYLQLFETTIRESLENLESLQIIVQKLFEGEDMHFFGRNNSATIKDFYDKPLNQIHAFYQGITKMIIQDKIRQTHVKLTQMTISDQYYTDCKDKDLLMSMLSYNGMKLFNQNEPVIRNKDGSIDYKKSAEALKTRSKKLAAYPHKSSEGYTVSQLKKWTLSTYWKNRRWMKNKALRVGNRKDLSDTQIKNVLQEQIPDNLVRFEVALWGIENILLANPSKILAEVRKLLDSIEKFVNYIIDDPTIQEMFVEMISLVPRFYYDENADPMQMEQPPPFIVSW